MGNPATDSIYGLAKHEMQLALLPIGADGRGNTYTVEIFQKFCDSWRKSGKSPLPVVLTHDRVAELDYKSRPAVGWLVDFRTTPEHLLGTVKLLPIGHKAIYGTHSSWSCEVCFKSGKLTVLGLALLGADLPHFDTLNAASIYYSKQENLDTKETMEIETNVDAIEDMDTLLDLNDRLNEEVVKLTNELADAAEQIEFLNEQLSEAADAIEGYEDQAIEYEVDELYGAVISYGCDCDKGELQSTYKATSPENRASYRNLITSVAKKAAEKANAVSKKVPKANLMYSADTTEACLNTESTLRRMGGR